MLKKNQNRRIIALFLSFAIIFTIHYYMNFESTHYVHECKGTDCPICHELHVAEAILNQLGTVILTVMCNFFLTTTIKKEAVLFECSFQERTLILDKVRIDD